MAGENASLALYKSAFTFNHGALVCRGPDMTCYFAFPSSDALRDSSLTLLENFERNVKEPQSTLFIRVAQLFADEVVDMLLLNLVRGSETPHSSAGVIESFAGLIKTTVHGLIKQLLSKMSNDELRPLSSVISDRRLTLSVDGTEKDYICFTMPADFHARFKRVLESGIKGERNPDELLACMEIFSEMAHVAFYEDSIKPLKLGFIGRKLTDVGGAAMRKGAISANRRLVPGLQGQELIDFCTYFHGFMLEA